MNEMHQSAEVNPPGPKRVILLGAPGVGKGTQAQAIQARLAVPHISTGDIFRRHVGDGTALGLRAKEYMDRGELVPDELTLEMVRQRLAEADATAGFLLDGFPRNVAQAHFLDRVLASSGTGVDAVIELHVAPAEILRRLTGRRTCSSCGKNWHVEFEPPTRPELCDACDGSLIQRDDDREQVIQRRLELHALQTAPLVDFYRARGLLTPVDADGPVDVVRGRTIAAVTA